jgi:plasmid maintenance system antidote protein VapI
MLSRGVLRLGLETVEFMKPLGIRINRLARDLHVPPKPGFSALCTGSAPSTWIPHCGLNLQTEYDLRVARMTSA